MHRECLQAHIHYMYKLTLYSRLEGCSDERVHGNLVMQQEWVGGERKVKVLALFSPIAPQEKQTNKINWCGRGLDFELKAVLCPQCLALLGTAVSSGTNGWQHTSHWHQGWEGGVKQERRKEGRRVQRVCDELLLC